jgi:hypothetical protein
LGCKENYPSTRCLLAVEYVKCLTDGAGRAVQAMTILSSAHWRSSVSGSNPSEGERGANHADWRIGDCLPATDPGLGWSRSDEASVARLVACAALRFNIARCKKLGALINLSQA